MQHRSFVFGHVFDVPAATLFDVFADAQSRQDLGAVNGTLKFDLQQADFRIGGTDLFRFGQHSLKFHGQTQFHDIVPDQRIVATECITLADRPLSLTTLTMEFAPSDDRTRFKLTTQVAALDDADLFRESTIRSELLVESLIAYLSRRPQA
ncbi:MAG: hypothetical protein RLZ98_1788 [Pseudomonadota bacterium]